MRRALVVAVVLLVGFGSAAEASPITYNFTVRLSEFTDSSGFFGGALAAGSDLAGSFTYNSSAIDANSNLDAGSYFHSGAPYGGFVTGAGITFSVSNPTDNFRTGVGNQYVGVTDDFFVVFNDVATDFCTVPALCSSQFMGVDLKSTANLWDTDALPLALPSLDVFDAERRFFLYLTRDSGERVFAAGPVTSLTPSSAVPEPASLLLFGMGVLGLAGARRLWR